MNIAELVFKRRQELKLSREKLAFKSGVSSSLIWSIEDDHRGIAFDNLMRVFKALEIETVFMVKGEKYV